MDQSADDLPSCGQLADDLGKVALNGLGRPLYGKSTAADISDLLTVAGAMGVDLTLPLDRQVVEVVLPVIQRLRGPNLLAVKRLLWIENVENFTPARGKRIPLEGKDGGRSAYAADALGVSAAYFARWKRDQLLEDVAKQILSAARQRPQISSPLPAFDEGQPGGIDPDEVDFLYFSALAECSIRLHYAGIVPLFIYGLSHTLPYYKDSHEQESYFPSAGSVYNACSEILFSSYTDFLGAYQLRRDDDHLREYAEDMSDAGREKLRILHSLCSDYGPARFHGLDERVSNDPDHLSTLWRDGDFLYDHEWKSWYRKQVACPDPTNTLAKVGALPRPHHLAMITAASAAIFHTIRDEVTLAFPSESLAREAAYRQITGSYAFDQWVPIQDGRSLQELVPDFFEKQQAVLDKIIQKML